MALQEEDYTEAARLRDQGAAGLTGWWVADNQDDPKGHLLRISTGFGRYVGYAYTPQDLAQAEVGTPLHPQLHVMHNSGTYVIWPLMIFSSTNMHNF